VPEFHRLSHDIGFPVSQVADYNRRFGFSPTPEHVLLLTSVVTPVPQNYSRASRTVMLASRIPMPFADPVPS
jgi:hypothetical protein